MPLQNFHAARLSDPDSYDSYGYTHGGNLYGGKLKVLSTIDIVWGHPKGGPKAAAVPQSLRFPKAEWTEKEAKAWLKDNNVKNIGFEPAKEGDESARPIHRRFRGTNTAVNLAEQFFSLQQALNWAVQDRFGANTYVADFSDTEVMFRPDPGPVGVSVPQMPSDEYLKLSYAIEDGEVVLGDEEPEVVYRRSVYEPVDTEEMIQLTVRENQLKELAWKVHATHDKKGSKSFTVSAKSSKHAWAKAKSQCSSSGHKVLSVKAESIEEGGQGSGNFGHAGRPGEIGGSGGGGSDKTPHGNLQGSGLSYVQPLSKKASKQYAKQVDKLQGTLGRLWTRAKTVAREKGTQVNPSTDKYAHRYYKAKAMVFRQKPYNKGKWGLWSEATAAKVARVRAMVEGGSGSGNYGHAGRPGEVGGSGAGGTGGKEWTSYKAHPSKGTFVKRVSGKPSLGATSYQPDMAKGIFTKSTVSKGQADREKLLKKLEKMPAKYWSKKVLSTSALRQRGAPDFVLHKGKTYFRKGQAGKGNAFIIKKGITYFSRSKDKMATYQQKKGSAKYTFIGMKKSKNEMSLSDKVARVRGIVAAIGGAS